MRSTWELTAPPATQFILRSKTYRNERRKQEERERTRKEGRKITVCNGYRRPHNLDEQHP